MVNNIPNGGIDAKVPQTGAGWQIRDDEDEDEDEWIMFRYDMITWIYNADYSAFFLVDSDNTGHFLYGKYIYDMYVYIYISFDNCVLARNYKPYFFQYDARQY